MPIFFHFNHLCSAYKRHLRVIADRKLNVTLQMQNETKKPVWFFFWTAATSHQLSLYTILVRPCQEFCIQFWECQYQKDSDNQGRPHRLTTKMISVAWQIGHWVRTQETWVIFLTLPQTSGETHHLSVPLSPHLQNGDNDILLF